MKRTNDGNRQQCILVILVAAIALSLSVFMAACGSNGDETAKKQDQTTVTEQKETEETTEATSKATETTQAETEENTQAVQSTTKAVKNETKAKNENKETSKATTKATEKKASVCYITIEGYCSGKEIAIQNGDSVYDILKRSGAPVSARSTGYGIYIEAINGLAEFDKGPTSGWKYSVNGSDPGYGCDSYSVTAGDQISWYYVLEP